MWDNRNSATVMYFTCFSCAFYIGFYAVAGQEVIAITFGNLAIIYIQFVRTVGGTCELYRFTPIQSGICFILYYFYIFAVVLRLQLLLVLSWYQQLGTGFWCWLQSAPNDIFFIVMSRIYYYLVCIYFRCGLGSWC